MQYWEPLTEAELDLLHQSACRILSELGMIIHNSKAVEILVAAGAEQVDEHVVRFPQELVEKSIKQAPTSFMIYDRRGGEYMIGGDNHFHLPGGTMTEILDFPSNTRRPATLEDVRQLTRIVDSLDAVHFGGVMVEGMDAPEGLGEVMSCAEVLKNTTKFVLACPVEVRAAETFVDMAKALTGTDDLSIRPTIGLLATIIPGYEMDFEASESLLLAASEGIPLVLMGGGIQGAQSPATMAGTMLMGVASKLGALCIAQSIRPGTPILMDWGQVKLDMRTAEIEEAGPEFPLAIGAGTQLSRKYGIPSYACPAADSKIGDLQAGLEVGQTFMAAILAGANITVNAGTVSKCSAASYEMLVLHNEILRNMGRIRQGMRINEETLAVSLQIEVGLRGNYLSRPETVNTIRNSDEFLHKDLLDATGVRSEYQDPMEKAGQRWRQILEDHEVAISEAERQAVDKVVENYTVGGVPVEESIKEGGVT